MGSSPSAPKNMGLGLFLKNFSSTNPLLTDRLRTRCLKDRFLHAGKLIGEDYAKMQKRLFYPFTGQCTFSVTRIQNSFAKERSFQRFCGTVFLEC
jgi:hypothetical protein